MTRWPLEAVLGDQMPRQRVSLGVLLLADVTHIDAFRALEVFITNVVTQKMAATLDEIATIVRARIALV